MRVITKLVDRFFTRRRARRGGADADAHSARPPERGVSATPRAAATPEPENPPPAEPAAARDVCMDTLTLLAALLVAERVELRVPPDAEQPVRLIGKEERALAAPPAPPGPPTEAAYSADACTLLLPCKDRSGRTVALVKATGTSALRPIPAPELATFAAVLGHVVVSPDCAGHPPAEPRT